MKRFIEYFTLFEGGHAIKSVKISPIQTTNVKPTLEDLKKRVLKGLFKLKDNEWTTLGSTGKKKPEEFAGDIDVAIDYHPFLNYKNVKTVEDIYNYIAKELKKVSPEVNYIKGANIISFAYPIKGTQEGEFVQVDFMLTDNLKFTSWMYYGPSYLESKYKGVYRNLLLFAILKVISMKIRKTKNVNGEEIPVEIEKYVLNMTKGLTKIVQSRQGKSPDKILKNFKTIDRQILSKDPDEIVKLMFGDKYNSSNVLTFEQVWDLINSKDFKYNKHEVIKLFKEYLEDNKLPYPEELK